VVIVRLTGELAREKADELAVLTRSCVEAGASVSFLASSPDDDIVAYWHGIATEVAERHTALLIAVEGTALVGTVHVAGSPMPNGPHRAEVGKLLVHPEARRRGIGTALMAEAEEVARTMGRTLLVLDTVPGTAAERLYRRLGWRELGTIPGYALLPDGTPASSTFFWKDLAT
jgi:ribosomal protein S18 acetylase RimI-like enzyme